MTLLQHSPEEEIAGGSLSAQYGEVMGRPSQAILEHAGQNPQLDQTVPETEDLCAGFGPGGGSAGR